MKLDKQSKWFRNLQKKQKTIFTVDALCSAGKTYAFCKHAPEVLTKRNLLYIAPTEILIQQTSDGLRDEGLKPDCISSQTHSGNVKRALMECIATAPPRGHLVCATLSGYVDLPHSSWLKRDDWLVVIDEVPQLDFYRRFKLPRQKRVITDLLEAVPTTNENGLLRVRAKNAKALSKLLAGSMDDVEELFRDFLTTVNSHNKTTFVDPQNWDRVINHADGSVEIGDGEIRFLSLLNLKPFIGAVVMGANIHQSMLLHRFTRRHKCIFQPYEPIVKGLRGAHDVSSRLKISYFIPRKNVSRTQLDKKTSNDTTNLQEMDLAAGRAFGGEPFLYIRNGGDSEHDKHKSVLDDCSQAKRIKAVSHGLNSYTDYNNLYIGGSFNRNPHQFRMLDCLGLTADDVHRGYYHDLVYQAAMRTSLRDPDSTAMVHVIVADEPAAQALADMTGVTQIDLIKIDLNQRERLTQLHRQQSHAARQQLNVMFQDSEQNPIESKGKCSNSGLDASTGCNIPPYGRGLAVLDNSDGIQGAEWKGCVTLHKTVAPKFSTDLREWSFSAKKFVAGMKKLSKNIVGKKEDLPLFNASTFILPALKTAGNFKTNECFRQSSLLVTDIDGGSMSIDDAVRIFWTKADVVRSFLIYRTFSATLENPNFFRVIFFCAKPCKSLEQHLAMYQEIVEQMARAGFSESDAKLDKQSKSPVQSWYLPGQNRNRLGLRYCEAFGTRSRELVRYAMDPEACLARSPNILRFDEENSCDTPKCNGYWQQESMRWLEVLSGLTEGRNEALFKAVQALKFSGATDDETRLRVRQATHFDPKMFKKIEDAVKRVNKPWKGKARFASLQCAPRPSSNCA